MTTIEIERKIRRQRQRFGMLRATNVGRKYTVEYVDRHGIYHTCEHNLNHINANEMLRKWQRNWPELHFEILEETR